MREKEIEREKEKEVARGTGEQNSESVDHVDFSNGERAIVERSLLPFASSVSNNSRGRSPLCRLTSAIYGRRPAFCKVKSFDPLRARPKRGRTRFAFGKRVGDGRTGEMQRGRLERLHERVGWLDPPGPTVPSETCATSAGYDEFIIQ